MDMDGVNKPDRRRCIPKVVPVKFMPSSIDSGASHCGVIESHASGRKIHITAKENGSMRLIRRVLKWGACLLLLLVVGAVIFACVYGHAPAKRPDLVTPLPEGVPAPPHGYPSEITAFAAGYLFYDLIPLENGPAVPGVVMKADIQYGTGDGKPLYLDLYSPESPQTGPVPGILLFYGGSWKGGRKDQLRVYAQYFAQHGYVVATPQYRLREEGRWPRSVQDAKCAVRWMRAHAAENRVDPDRIGVMGNSAGGYLSMMVGFTAGVAEFEGGGGWQDQSSAVQAVVDVYGPTDFTEPVRRDNSAVVDYMGGHYEEDPARYEKASPIRYVTDKTPPTCVIHGTVDMLVPVHQSDWLVEKLKEKGVPHCYSRINGWPHAMDAVLSVNKHTRALSLNFFDRYLKKDGGGK
jgi:acetyl esterase/lipase